MANLTKNQISTIHGQLTSDIASLYSLLERYRLELPAEVKDEIRFLISEMELLHNRTSQEFIQISLNELEPLQEQIQTTTTKINNARQLIQNIDNALNAVASIVSGLNGFLSGI
ncbi:MAG TPA: hypothetical protein DCF68_00705 [Cyanothece sp. UBA12306]|nr:hypothetical protein [Cyanothece sp. UBA12306]